MYEAAAAIAITHYEKAAAASAEQRRLLKAALIEFENNRYLLRACFLDADATDAEGNKLTHAEGQRAVAKRLGTDALQALLWSGHTDTGLLDELEGARSAPVPDPAASEEDVDADARSKAPSLSARLVWLYRKIVTTRTLADAYGEQESVPGLRKIRFRQRLENIDVESREIARAAREVLAMSPIERWGAWTRVMFSRLLSFMSDGSSRLWHGTSREDPVGQPNRE